MHYELGTIHQLHVSGIVILAVMIEVKASWRRVVKDDSSARLPRGDTR
jgi:hypothetical protein